MSIARFLVLVLALAAVAFAAKYALEGASRDRSPHSEPRRQLDNVRSKAKDLEKQLQKDVDDLNKNSDGR
jgi:Ni/Co efflux regulator RcnB